jgi:rubrerythrin
MSQPSPLEEVIAVLEMMQAVERHLGSVYATCARIWPVEADFWNGLAAGEEQHAAYAARMAQLVAEKPNHFRANRQFNTATVRFFVKYVEETRERLESGGLDRRRMLGLARDMENGLIERKFFLFAESDDLEYRSMVQEIIQQTQEHRDALQRMIESSS